MLQLITRRGNTENPSDHPAWKHDGEISLSGSMTRQVRVSPCAQQREALTFYHTIDGARPPSAGCDIPCTKRRKDGRGYGNQDA
jgi:hypothetical protein